jgi:hypothetical protein
MNQDIIQLLGKPFPYEDIKSKIQAYNGDKTKGMAVFYVDSRAIQTRLDEVVGMFKWKNQFSPWSDKAQICGISIFDEARCEWVTKFDGADNTDIEAIKGGLSDAFKRSAVMWSIGRYLYRIGSVWVDLEQRGKNHYIKDDQLPKLKAMYEGAVKRLFGDETNKQPVAGNANPPATQAPPTSPQTKQPPAATPPQAAADQPTQPKSQSTPPPSHENAQAPPVIIPPGCFKIHSVKPSGKESQLLELCDNNGEIISAYVKLGVEGIAVGAHLRNVKIEQKSNAYKKFNMLTQYEVAKAA